MLSEERDGKARKTRGRSASELRPGRALAFVIALLALLIVGATPKKTTHKKDSKDVASASASLSALVEASGEALSASASVEPVVSSAPVAAPPPSASVAPVVSAPPSARAAPSASARPAGSAEAGNDVKLHDVPVFTIRVGHGSQTAAARARTASDALEDAAKDVDPSKVHVDQEGAAAVIYADKIPIVQLYIEDAVANGDASLDVHADTIKTRVQNAINDEQKRSAIAKTVLSVCGVILGALILIYLLRTIGEWSRKLKSWLEANPERFSALRLRTFEVVGASALRGAIGFALSVGKWLAQIGVVYLYLIVIFSLFASTRGYRERLTGFVFTPLSQFMTRVASSVPVLVVLLVVVVVVVVMVRFVRLFFGAIARGETHVEWLPADLAEPTSLLLRIGIVLGAIVFAAPIITGESEGVLARLGTIALVAIAIAAVPMLASVLAGISVIYLRRLRPGEYAEFGGRSGRIVDVGLLEVKIQDAEGCELRVPQVLGLWHPTRILGVTPRVVVEISVAPTAPLEQVAAVLLQAASSLGGWPKVELVGIDADGAHHHVSIGSAEPNARAELLAATAKALQANKIALGRRHAAPR